jgi:hypothetical protein
MRHEQGVVYDRPQGNQPAPEFPGQGVLALKALQGKADAQAKAGRFGAYDPHGRLSLSRPSIPPARAASATAQQGSSEIPLWFETSPFREIPA